MQIGLRDQRIDVLRGVAILLVLVHHFNIAYRLDGSGLARWLGWDGVQSLARNGNYGVTMFFTLSGTLITCHARRRWPDLAAIDVAGFYRLRIARILPCLLLLLALVNALALAGVALFQNHPAVPFWLVDLAALTFWTNLLIAHAGWVNYPLGVLWSLAVEEVFYLTFPLTCRLLRRETTLALLWAAVIVIGPLYRLAHQGDEAGTLYAYWASFDGIAVGCCTALLVGRVRLPNWAAILAASAMAILYLARPIAQTNAYGVSLMSLGTAILILASPDRSSQPGLARPVAACGRLSYELYLFHLMALAGMRSLLPARAVTGGGRWLLLAAFLILSVGLARLVARLFSEPLNRRLRSPSTVGRA